jgi:quercetin dioxygenase-like cupin family protein
LASFGVAGTAAATVKILKMKRENPTVQICPGITRRTVANGKAMYQMIATLAAGSRMPEHRHPQEQIICASNR